MADSDGCSPRVASSDMADIIDRMLATGARIDEILALRRVDVAHGWLPRPAH